MAHNGRTCTQTDADLAAALTALEQERQRAANDQVDVNDAPDFATETEQHPIDGYAHLDDVPDTLLPPEAREYRRRAATATSERDTLAEQLGALQAPTFGDAFGA